MALHRLCLLAVVLSVLLLDVSEAQENPQQCMSKFTQGKDDFVLDTDESVKEGATFLSSPQVSTVSECVSACCSDPNCNLALIESTSEESTIHACFTFNCLYKQKQVCRFVRKTGFKNYLLNSGVFRSYLQDIPSTQEDKPPKAKAGQDRVIQPNEVVTLNGIESKDDHKIVDFKWTLVSGNPSAVIEKSHFPDQVTVSKLTAGVYKFRLTVTDNIGQSDSTEITVLVLTPEQTHHHCLVPKKAGPCRGSFPRWHYNAASEKCEEFTFGGCKENRNNYLSREECLNACDKVSVLNNSTLGRHGPIDLPSEQCGVPCGAETFVCANGCCIDKELECDQTKQCSDGSDEEQCDKLGSKFRRLLDIPVDVDKARCTQPPVTGPCRASFTKWYYNPYDRKCNRFNYGGCQGNDNQFETQDHCSKVCTGVTESDVFLRSAAFEKQTGENNTAAIGIAVALGLAILVLVAVIGYCLLKGKKKPKHQRVAVNGAHSFPIEDTEKLVYNSTTKPI
ncbi:kunitz-type protease inhibitor 1a [Astyanax mexicanus]|uniref:kunitz-type protease inhibitor 1a n=1 Tax=Astyanax mexicanus TaxID=7994 RepID=UPI0020CB53C1|nr:kunitz-type protease inhibitor 1a [Astyanax mexicanus]XP_022528299.2 kunitz-type protease inhibitor 1a [Astyanax mexicanus]